MAAFSVIGFIDSLRFLPDSCLLYISEYKKGYRKSSGEIIDDRYVQWVVIFKGYFRKYLADHFGNGMLVEVKGEVFPYAIEHGKVVEGISVIGQTCNLFSYPRNNVKSEIVMRKESQDSCKDKPDLDGYNQPDF